MPTAPIGEVELYYEEHGRGQPLIMVLGLGQDIATWGFQIEELSKHLRLVVFDNRDAGKSSRLVISMASFIVMFYASKADPACILWPTEKT